MAWGKQRKTIAWNGYILSSENIPMMETFYPLTIWGDGTFCSLTNVTDPSRLNSITPDPRTDGRLIPSSHSISRYPPPSSSVTHLPLLLPFLCLDHTVFSFSPRYVNVSYLQFFPALYFLSLPVFSFLMHLVFDWLPLTTFLSSLCLRL
jgi:hypothetical protein